MDSAWVLYGGGGRAYSGAEARLLLRNRMDHGSLETWFVDGAGRMLGVVANGERAMVLLLGAAGDPGEHLVDPGAPGDSGGYVLANGQVDVYADRDTVPFDRACRAVAHLIDVGGWPPDATVAESDG
ncbi:hypothetical protein AB0M28_08195 [Streptomyces sp. NPDC051940]|uniref:hypothetical protein n=1 Tax=Streptomyces sp. NPDC051940 TaxID=3155675 RepID=UPI00341BF7C4